MKRSIIILAMLLVLCPIGLSAHEGHGWIEATQIGHYLTSPVHIIPVSLALGLGIYLWIRRYRKGVMSET